jgi:hypothetical protein
MKQVVLSVLCTFFSVVMIGQSVPQAINYQAVVRDANYQPYTNELVSLRMSVLQGSTTGSVAYSETFNLFTNEVGLIAIAIGQGQPIFGELSDVDWGQGPFFLRMEVDLDGGTDYETFGTSQILSVPYALYAETTGDVDDADADPMNEIQTISKQGNEVTLSNGGGSFTDDVEDADADPINELQSLTKQGDQIMLSDGGSVTDEVNDADADSTNELQTLSKQGDLIMLSNGGFVTDEVDDADADATNELQNLTINGQTLSISQGNSVLLPSGGTTKWKDGPTGIYYDQGSVGIGTELVNGRLTVDGPISVDDITGATPGHGILHEWGGISLYGADAMDYTTYIGLRDRGSLELRYGSSILVYSEAREEAGILETHGSSLNTYLGTFSDNKDNGLIFAANSGGTETAFLFSDPVDETGVVSTYSTNSLNTVLGYDLDNPEIGYIGVYDQNGTSNVELWADDDHAGSMLTYGPSSLNSGIGFLQGYLDHGYITVFDRNDNNEAGMFIDEFGRGIIFGDIKSFKTQDPNNPDQDIWYASLEGPEAGAYDRGTSTLINGEVRVSFADHFQSIANPDDMTVMLTPLDRSSKGLAVIEKTANGFVVAELDNGKGNYSFDWEVKCKRKGLENFEVYRGKDSDSFQKAPRKRLNSNRLKNIRSSGKR